MSSSSHPLISVVMTVWNGESLIGESIDSILRQTFTDFELIVIDDGSTDGTCAVVESFQDPRVRLIRRPHLGIVASANHGLSLARGRYIARLDADDLSHPDRLESQIRVFQARPDTTLCFTDIEVFGDLTGYAKAGIFVFDNGLIGLMMCFRCPIIHSSVLYRKDACDKVGGYLETTPVAEDYSLYTRLHRLGPFVGIPRKLVKYRRTFSSATYRHYELMARLAHDIALDHMQTYLRIESGLAEKFLKNLHLPPPCRDKLVWLHFCRVALSRTSTWSVQPLGWLFLQTLKMFGKSGPKIKNRSESNVASVSK